MLNRRHLRIKVLQALYAYYQSNEESFHKTEKDLLEAVEKIYDLYIYLILTFGELKAHAERRIEDNKSKIRPSEDELNPNLKFVNNSIIQLLDEHKELRVISESRKVNWVGDDVQEMLRKMLLNLRDSETFFEFMNNGESGFEEDKQFVLALFKIVS